MPTRCNIGHVIIIKVKIIWSFNMKLGKTTIIIRALSSHWVQHTFKQLFVSFKSKDVFVCSSTSFNGSSWKFCMNEEWKNWTEVAQTKQKILRRCHKLKSTCPYYEINLKVTGNTTCPYYSRKENETFFFWATSRNSIEMQGLGFVNNIIEGYIICSDVNPKLGSKLIKL